MFVPERAHGRDAGRGDVGRELGYVGLHRRAELDVLLQVHLRVGTVGPCFVRTARFGPRMTWSWSTFARGVFSLALAMSMSAEDRTKASKLVPADNKLLHVWALIVLFASAAVAAYVGGPPRDAR